MAVIRQNLELLSPDEGDTDMPDKIKSLSMDLKTGKMILMMSPMHWYNFSSNRQALMMQPLKEHTPVVQQKITELRQRNWHQIHFNIVMMELII